MEYLNDKLPYDKSDAISIFEYSKKMLHKALRDFLTEDYKPRKGKGGLGQMVENIFFQLETNNNPEADFSAAGMELKCTPLKSGKNQEYLIKERLVCNMINYTEVVNESFETSHFYLKCQLMLLLFYLYKKDQNNLDLEFIFSVLWKLPEKDLLIIRHDYEVIIDKIKHGEAHLLSEGDTMYLGACRKGQKGDSLMQQPFSPIGAPRRAFSLKMAYMRTILKYVLNSGRDAVANFKLSQQQLVSANSLYENNFDEIIINRFAKYMGVDYEEIAKETCVDISRNPKNKFALIASAVAAAGKCGNVNKTEEFLKAGLTMKTIRVQADGTIKESMSFENIDYMEIAECNDWYESRLYEIFSSRFLFVIFREQHKGCGDYRLDDAFFWTMPQEDLTFAEEYWHHIRNNVLANHISEEYWWKAGDRKKFHVRPKAQKSKDMAPNPNGGRAKKFCYWFNNDYITEIINSKKQITA